MADNLDDILRKRKVPAAGSHLAERIIDMAKSRPQESGATWSVFLSAFRQAFLVPQPALAFAIVLFLGVMTGLELDENATITPEELAATFVIEDNLKSGDWL